MASLSTFLSVTKDTFTLKEINFNYLNQLIYLMLILNVCMISGFKISIISSALIYGSGCNYPSGLNNLNPSIGFSSLTFYLIYILNSINDVSTPLTSSNN